MVRIKKQTPTSALSTWTFMVANDYSAAVPVPVCDILLKIGGIMWFCDFYLWCDIFIFYDLNLSLNRLKINLCKVCTILIPNFNAICPHIIKLHNIYSKYCISCGLECILSPSGLVLDCIYLILSFSCNQKPIYADISYYLHKCCF